MEHTDVKVVGGPLGYAGMFTCIHLNYKYDSRAVHRIGMFEWNIRAKIQDG